MNIVDPVMEPATDRLVAHLDHGECYADNYRDENFGEAVGDLIAAAHALAGVTTHVNVTGAEYQDRKPYYGHLRSALSAPELAPVLRSLGLVR